MQDREYEDHKDQEKSQGTMQDRECEDHKDKEKSQDARQARRMRRHRGMMRASATGRSCVRVVVLR